MYDDKTYLRSEIRHVLLALMRTNASMARHSRPHMLAYHAGYKDALLAMADAFGVTEASDFLWEVQDECHLLA